MSVFDAIGEIATYKLICAPHIPNSNTTLSILAKFKCLSTFRPLEAAIQ